MNDELVVREHTDLSTPRAAALDDVIDAWLASKANKSGSVKTERAYGDTMRSFRAYLHTKELDLDADPRVVARWVQEWAGRDKPAPATFNQRLAIISSFYIYVRKQGLYEAENPISRAERRTVQAYADAQALTPDEVSIKIASIDRSYLDGQRDHALLSVALTTGRRVAELAAMRWQNIHIANDRVTLTFERAKGGKVMRDQLDVRIGKALLAYIVQVYGPRLGELAPNAPIWVNCSTNGTRGALSARSLEEIAHKRLGVHFHALRHTFARGLEDAGAKVSQIQARLGHASLATTGRYLAALRSAENPHAARLVDLFGLADE